MALSSAFFLSLWTSALLCERICAVSQEHRGAGREVSSATRKVRQPTRAAAPQLPPMHAQTFALPCQKHATAPASPRAWPTRLCAVSVENARVCPGWRSVWRC
eukprot:2246671-Rhodomonas_salina.2